MHKVSHSDNVKKFPIKRKAVDFSGFALFHFYSEIKIKTWSRPSHIFLEKCIPNNFFLHPLRLSRENYSNL